jgi:hypothetical protein
VDEPHSKTKQKDIGDESEPELINSKDISMVSQSMTLREKTPEDFTSDLKEFQLERGRTKTLR